MVFLIHKITKEKVYRKSLLILQMNLADFPHNFSSMAERKSINNLYYEIYKWKMKHAPKNIGNFCDGTMNDSDRSKLVRWLR